MKKKKGKTMIFRENVDKLLLLFGWFVPVCMFDGSNVE